jgi:HEPN domain-containing protein
MDRRDLRALSRVRLSEAKALLKAGLPNGAYYLAGYAVECALKACIAKETQRYEFPEKKRVDASYTHNLKELVRVADLRDELQAAEKADALFEGYWGVVQLWSEQSRYSRHSPESSQELIQAIGDRDHGVMKWVRHYW